MSLYCHVFRDANLCAKGAVEQRIKLTVGAEAALSDAIADSGTTRIKFVRIAADEDCFVEFDAAPVADDASLPLSADAPEYFEIPVGFKISVIEKA